MSIETLQHNTHRQDKSSILVIVVTYNAMEWVDRCLESIDQSTIKADTFVVDNGSTDGTRKHIATKFPGAILIESEENLFFGKANNVGLRYAVEQNYDYVYLLNQDAWLKPDALQLMLDAHKKNPEYGILSPMQLQSNEEYFDDNFGKFSIEYEVNKGVFNDLYFNRMHDVYEVKFAAAAHWLISRECLLKTGLFSPSFIHYGEDVNYTDRAAFHKFKIGIVPLARAIHARENRPIPSRAKRCYIWYTRQIVSVSDINVGNSIYLLTLPLRTFYAMRNYGCGTLPYFFKFVKNASFFLKNAEASKKTGAFF